MDKWKVLAQAFENIGDKLALECASMHVLCTQWPEYDEFYGNYAQLLNSINA